MKEIVFGTTNKSKVEQVRGALAPKGVMVIDITDLIDADKLPAVDESGNSHRENARLKAVAYAKAVGRPVFATDNALFIDGFPDDEQPGVHVRRLKGWTRRPTDTELLDYYVTLVKKLGGEVGVRWESGYCIASSGGVLAERVAVSERCFVSTPSATVLPGYPLESIQIDPVTGKYVAEMTKDERAAFWQRNVGDRLAAFIISVP